MSDEKHVGDDDETPLDFVKLVQTAADPSSSTSIPTDRLSKILGIDNVPSRQEALDALEKDLLAPVKDLSGDLWQWQVQPPITLPLPPLTLSPLPPTHTILPATRGLSGQFTHWRETLAPKAPAHPALSSSTSRAPGSLQNFVRGKGSYAPFLPGGLEPEIAPGERVDHVEDEEEDDDDDDDDEEEGWKTRAPGFRRGVKLQGAEDLLAEMLGDQHITSKAKRRRRDGQTTPTLEVSRLGDDDIDKIQSNGPSIPGRKNVDDLLPIGRFPTPPPPRKHFRATTKKEWAHVVDVNRELVNFDELVPEMARKYPFTLDNFQKEAVYRLEMGDSVFVAAHTSAGKTAVAEYAIALAAKHMTKAIYTSPIKALSNQKFRDFKTSFDPSTVGILTGDVQINAEGSCLIMTTEILRSMLYKGADLIRDVEFVIFDEVHYVNDAERGVVWEEVIIMLPEHVNIILLSATVPNTKEFADWVGRTKKKDIYVISTPMRPVPLEHFLWAGRDLHKIVDSKSNFIGDGYKSATESLRRKQDKEREAAGLPPVQRTGGRGGASNRAKDLPTGRGAPFTRTGAGRTHTNRGGGINVAPSSAPPSARGGRGGRGGGFGPPSGRGFHLDQNIWTHLINHLRKNKLLPVVNFVFSKKRCEEYAGTLQNMDLCDAKEKSEVHITWERALNRLKGSDKTLPQIRKMRELLSRGIGVHHGGLLPLVKEVVEILFSRGLVKVLFATETFAMGVNMPAKSVVFSGIRKHDGHAFRNLLPGEYTQMAGRAGRRGLDTTGTVIILSGDELPTVKDLTEMMLGTPNRLSSQFRLTYNMILNLLRVEALRVEEMIKRSFSENATQKLAPEQQKQIAHTEKQLARLPNVDCPVCNTDIDPFYEVSAEVVRINSQLIRVASFAAQGGKLFAPGRVVVLQNGHYPGNLAVLLRSAPNLVREGMRADAKAFHVLVLVTPRQKAGHQDIKQSEIPPRWPPILPNGSFVNPTWELTAIDATSITFVVNSIFKVDPSGIMDKRSEELAEKTMHSLAIIHEELASLPELPEIEWTRIRALEFQSLLKQRYSLSDRLAKLNCQQCPDFDDHYAILHERKVVEGGLKQLKLVMSDHNLELLPDYESRVEVLKRLQFIDENATVLLKGRVACEINSANELILTELILENVLAEYTPEEVVALLSIFVFVEKTSSQPQIIPKLAEGLEVIYRIAEEVEREQDRCSVQYDEFAEKFKIGLVEVVYEWARGMPFNQITDLTDIPEGTIVRVITRLDETCREVRDAARVIGDADLFAKMEQAQNLIKRDIVFAASLYL